MKQIKNVELQVESKAQKILPTLSLFMMSEMILYHTLLNRVSRKLTY